jgi:MFS superfamily sulfate permease-like transporter
VDWNLYHDGICIRCNIADKHSGSSVVLSRITLIFIEYGLVYEWLVEIRHKVFLSRYAIVWATFLAIQVVGMDAGIILGVLVAIVMDMWSQQQRPPIHRVNKRESRSLDTR